MVYWRTLKKPNVLKNFREHTEDYVKTVVVLNLALNENLLRRNLQTRWERFKDKITAIGCPTMIYCVMVAICMAPGKCRGSFTLGNGLRNDKRPLLL